MIPLFGRRSGEVYWLWTPLAVLFVAGPVISQSRLAWSSISSHVLFVAAWLPLMVAAALVAAAGTARCRRRGLLRDMVLAGIAPDAIITAQLAPARTVAAATLLHAPFWMLGNEAIKACVLHAPSAFTAWGDMLSHPFMEIVPAGIAAFCGALAAGALGVRLGLSPAGKGHCAAWAAVGALLLFGATGSLAAAIPARLIARSMLVRPPEFLLWCMGFAGISLWSLAGLWWLNRRRLRFIEE